MKRNRKMGILTACAVLLTTVLSGCGGAATEPAAPQNGGSTEPGAVSEAAFKMTIGAAITDKDWRSQGLMDFEKLVEERSEGAIDVELFFGGVLGNDSELVQKVQMNNIQGVITSTSNLSRAVEKLQVLDLPFAAPQPEQYLAFYEDGKFGGKLTEELQEQASEKALRLMYLYPFQSRQVATKNKIVKTVDDIRGLNIRTSASEVERGIISSFGASPITLGITEVYTALQTGTIDGEGLPFTDMLSFNHSEVAPKVSFVNFQSMAVIVAISKEFYDSLPADLQQIVTDAASEVGLDGINYMNEANEAAIAEMEAQGVEFYYNTPEDLDTFRAASQSVVEQLSDGIGEEWIHTVFDELNAHLE